MSPKSPFTWQYQAGVDPLQDIPVPDQWYPYYPAQIAAKIPNTHTQFAFHPDPIVAVSDQFYPHFPDIISGKIPLTPYEFVTNIEPVITPDKWKPFFTDVIYPIVAAIQQNAQFVRIDEVVPDHWYPILGLVPADVARLQYMYPFLAIDADFSSVPPVISVTGRTSVVLGIHGFFVEDSGNITNTPLETD